MVSSCSASNCSNRKTKTSKKSFHSFPLHDKKLLKKWKDALKRKNWTPTKASRLCSDHFDPSLIIKCGNHLTLMKGSIPTRFSHESIKTRDIESNEGSTEFTPISDEQTPKDIEHHDSLNDVNTTLTPLEIPKSGSSNDASDCTPTLSCDEFLKAQKDNYKEAELQLYKRVTEDFYTSNMDVASKCHKIKSNLEKYRPGVTRLLRDATKSANAHQLAFISAQLTNGNKEPAARVWTAPMKNAMVGLYNVSPSAFRYLSKILVLPMEEEVENWIKGGFEWDVESESDDNPNESLEQEREDRSPDGEGNTSKETETVRPSIEISSILKAQAFLDNMYFENLISTLL